MKIYVKYLVLDIIKRILLTLALLTSLFAFFKLLAEMGKVGTFNYDFTDALMYVLLSTPLLMQSIIGVAVLIGAIISFGGINSAHNVQIFQTGKVSPKSIILTYFIVSSLILSTLIVFVEFFSKESDINSERYRANAMGQSYIPDSSNNFWIKKDDYFIFFGAKNKENLYKNLIILSSENNHKKFTYISSDNSYIDQNYLNMKSVQEIEVEQQDDGLYKFNQVTKPSEKLEIRLTQELVDLVNIKPRKLNIIELIQYVLLYDKSYLSQQYISEIIRRLIHPFVMLLSFLIIAPRLMSNNRNSSFSKRLSLGIIAGLIIHMLNRLTTVISLKWNLDLSFVSFIVLLVIFFIGYSAILKADKI